MAGDLVARDSSRAEGLVLRAHGAAVGANVLPAAVRRRDGRSPAAHREVATLTRWVKQLHEYDFGSFSDERLTISRDDYLPRREEFDLQADISASDSIRVVWAYLLGLLEIDAQIDTNHQGLLVLDEPRQQSTKEVSFEALLRRAGSDATGHQVIFATSEDLASLQAMLEDVPHTLQAVDGYVLKPVDD